MKRFTLFLLTLNICLSSLAQVKWEFKSVKIDSNAYHIIATAKIPEYYFICTGFDGGKALIKMKVAPSSKYKLIDGTEEMVDKNSIVMTRRLKVSDKGHFVPLLCHRQELTVIQVLEIKTYVPAIVGVIDYILMQDGIKGAQLKSDNFIVKFE